MNLLLIDDERFALEALQNAIAWETLGIDRVFSCSNITAAKDICKNETIHLIICDIEMPNGTGIEFGSWLSRRYPDTLLLFLTCHSEFHYAREAISCRAYAYLLKPFDIEELSSTVREAVQQIRKNQAAHARNALESHPADKLSIAEHFWQQLLRNTYENSTLDYILWNADSKGVSFDPDALYVPVLFYIVSMPSQTVDTGVLFFCIKNALNEIFLSGTGVPPAIEWGSRYFLALIPAEDMQDTQMFQDGCDRLFRFFHDNFQVTLQVLTGNSGDYQSLPGQAALLKNQAATLLASISEAASKENPKQLVQKIMKLIKENKTISREELAEQVFLSPDYMAKVFKRETGKKLIDYLSEVKLEEAKYRLSETNESISNIASSLAYSNFSYFSKMFKAETGMSPGEYRKKKKKTDPGR